MAKSTDQVFQLSLTEIAFMLLFIVLLLLGYLVLANESENKLLAAKVQNAAEDKALRDQLIAAKEKLAAALAQAGAAKPDEIISKMSSGKAMQAEQVRLKTQIQDMEAQITALAEVKKQIANASGQGADKVAQDQVISALALQNAVRQQLQAAPPQGTPNPKTEAAVISKSEATAKPPEPKLGPGKSATSGKIEQKKPSDAKALIDDDMRKQTVDAVARDLAIKRALAKVRIGQPALGEMPSAEDLVRGYQSMQAAETNKNSPQAIKKENANLRGQVAFLTGRLEAKGGRDYPPCWAEEKTGKIEFLMTVDIQNGGLTFSKGWPAHRDAEAHALPGVDALLDGGMRSLADFSAGVQALDAQSKKANCRHYVFLKNHVNELDVFNRYRFGVENFFYKLELRK